MPHPRNKTKASGDVHLPELEDETGRPATEATDDMTPDNPLGRDLENEGRAGKGINQAGYLKDKDAPGAGGSKREKGRG